LVTGNQRPVPTARFLVKRRKGEGINPVRGENKGGLEKDICKEREKTTAIGQKTKSIKRDRNGKHRSTRKSYEKKTKSPAGQDTVAKGRR